MFTQFALVVIFSLAVSLLDATTVVPMLATRVIHGEAHRESLENGRNSGLVGRAFVRFGQWFNALDAAYRRALQWAIHHRPLTIGGAVAITALSLSLLPQIGTELMPATDSGDFTVSVKLPVGTALSKTDEVMQRVEQSIASNPNVATVFATVGSRGGMGGGQALTPYQGGVSVKLKDDRTQSTLEVICDLRRQLSGLPGVQARLFQMDLVTNLMTGGNPNLEVDIFGDDLATLSAIARDVMSRVRGLPGFENVDVNWQEAMPEIQWQRGPAESAPAGRELRRYRQHP